MKVACCVLAVASGFLAVAHPASAERLTVERLHEDPSLDGPAVTEVKPAPDGRHVAFLRPRPENKDHLDLWLFARETRRSRLLLRSEDLAPEPAQLSEEEKNRRERQRIYTEGVSDYFWDAQGKRLLVPAGGDLFLFSLGDRSVRRLTETEAFETDAKVSPQGGFVSFIRNDEVFVIELSSGVERRLTSGAGNGVRNGVAEFVAQEEMGRHTGYWWAEDDSRIAFAQIDENPVGAIERIEIDTQGARTVRQRYPKAGTDNVRIRLGIAPVSGGAPVWADLGPEPDIYLARAAWAKDGSRLYVQRENRGQTRLDLLAVNPGTGKSRIVSTQNSSIWINLTDNLHLSKGAPDRFWWTSEKTGFRHVYAHEGGGSRALTSGDWPVDELLCVDEAAGFAFFTGWRETPLERHVFRVNLAGGAPERLTKGSGWHEAVFAKDCSLFVLTYSADGTPPQTSLHGPDGARIAWLEENSPGPEHPYHPYLDSHEAAQFGVVKAEDGTPLHYSLLKPADLKPGERRPAIVLVYGGPHAQTVRRKWGDHLGQLLADEGYVVFRLDNRGMANRGMAFEAHIYRRMGGVEVRDQAAGAEFLRALPYVDKGRIGVYGWSYGGYMTLMLMAQRPDLFRAGVAGAPVTDWALYDTHYTERYLGHPKRNARGYAASSVFAHLGGLKGRLLLIHGMADDNVLFSNSLEVMRSLQGRGQTFELMTYPGEKHGLRERAHRLHRDRMILKFFRERLKLEQ